jgi:hypothetical protein
MDAYQRATLNMRGAELADQGIGGYGAPAPMGGQVRAGTPNSQPMGNPQGQPSSQPTNQAQGNPQSQPAFTPSTLPQYNKTTIYNCDGDYIFLKIIIY